MSWKTEVEEYLTWLETRHEKNQGREVTSTYLRQSRWVLQKFGKELNPSSFADLTQDDINGWVAAIRKDGISEASVRSYMGIVRAALRRLNDGEVPACLKGLTFGGFKSRVESYDDLVDDEELERVLSVLALPWRTAVRLIRHSGARPGEVLGLRRRDARIVTKEGREFVILSFPKTKTFKPRSAVVSDPRSIETLKEYISYAPESKWLFPARDMRDENGEPLPMPYGNLWRALDRACKKTEAAHIFPYQLRHTWASKEGARMPSHIRSRQMGSTSETIMSNYDSVGAEGLLEAHLELGGGAPVVREEAADGLFKVITAMLKRQLETEDLIAGLSIDNPEARKRAFTMAWEGQQMLADLQKAQKELGLEGESD